MNADGSNQRRLTDDIGMDSQPFFSPSGEKIVFSSEHVPSEGLNIYTMNTDGTHLQKLTPNTTAKAFDSPLEWR
jgi:TolB protein